ncbi:CMD domain protein [Cellulomonas endophytica]|uniref:CMD domain protein n=1 Tax=Cellulomonas endophytica TaxID=2494735 RepID=UPI00101072CB|nr:CMD domain protein [Cellulomonas endophytica]
MSTQQGTTRPDPLALVGEDVVDTLLGITPGSALDAVRANRPEARAHAQGTFTALFAPADAAAMPLPERWAVAAFVAALHGPGPATDLYRRGLETVTGEGSDEGLVAAVRGAAADGAAPGPYGRYREPALAAESVPGPVLALAPEARAVLGARLAAALEHAHLLVLHPRDARREHLDALLSAGWDATGVVTLSQLVSFLTFQLRVVHGLAALAEHVDRRTGGAA